jgi:hypothetical protein
MKVPKLSVFVEFHFVHIEVVVTITLKDDVFGRDKNVHEATADIYL